jgi:hypothetical protein
MRMKYMKSVLAKSILLGLFISLSLYSSAQKTKKYEGIYKYNIADSLTGFLKLYPESDSTMFFYIRNTSIASETFSWGNYGLIIIKDNTGMYSEHSDPGLGIHWDCTLSFKFGKGQVTITTVVGHGECLYGPNISADGIYILENNVSPNYFIYAKKDTIYFNRTTLKSWHEL